MKKTITSIIMLAIAGLFLTACGSQASDSANTSETVAAEQSSEASSENSEEEENSDATSDEEVVKVGLSTITQVSWAPCFVAQSEGFFADEGLEVEFITPGGPKGFQAMHAGQCEFSMLSQEPLLIAAEEGMESYNIAAMLKSRVYGIISSPDITEISQLKGKTVYASDPGSAPYVFVCTALEKNGIDPERDVTFIQMDQNAAPLALANGEIDAAFINLFKTAELKDVEYNTLVSCFDEDDAMEYLGSTVFPAEIVCTTKAYAEEHPEVCQKMVNALIRAEEWIQDHSDEEVAESISPLLVDFDPEILAEEVAIMRDIYSTDGYISEEGQAAVIKTLKDAGVIKTDIPYDDVVDMEFVENYKENK